MSWGVVRKTSLKCCLLVVLSSTCSGEHFFCYWKQKLGQLGDGSQGTKTDTFKTSRPVQSQVKLEWLQSRRTKPSIYGGFFTWGIPKTMGVNTKIVKFGMIWILNAPYGSLWLRKPIIFNASDDFGWGRQTRANPSDQQPGSLAAVVSAPEFLTVVFAAFNILSLLRASWRMVDVPSMVFHKNRSWMRNQEPAITNTLRVWELDFHREFASDSTTTQPHQVTWPVEAIGFGILRPCVPQFPVSWSCDLVT